MSIRTMMIAFAASALFFSFTGAAFAYDGSWHGGRHGFSGYRGMTPQQEQAYSAMIQEYESKITPLEEKAMSKRMELDVLSQNPNTKPETLSNLTQELTELRIKIRKERLALDEKMAKEIGAREDGSTGYFYHRRGYGGYRGGCGGCNY